MPTHEWSQAPTHAHAHAQAHAHMLNVKCMSLADFFSFMGPRAGLETIEAVTALPREGGERILIFESPLYNVESSPADSRKRRPSGWVCCPECHGATCCKCAEMGRVWQSTCGEAVQLMWPALSQPYISTNDRAWRASVEAQTVCGDSSKSCVPIPGSAATTSTVIDGPSGMQMSSSPSITSQAAARARARAPGSVSCEAQCAKPPPRHDPGGTSA